MGTPWTAHNSNIPAYPNVFTPDPTGRYLVGSPGVSQGGQGTASSPRQAVVITGADIAIQPVPQHAVFEQDVQAPAQEGPLTYYPTLSIIDPRHKWQRIRDWASKDSATATGAPSTVSSGGAGAPAPGPPANAGEVDVTASIDSTLLDLELERARASIKAANAAGGGTSSVAAAISAAAAAVRAAPLHLHTAAHSAGGALAAARQSAADLIGMPSSLSVGAAAPRAGATPREPSFGGFGSGAAAAAAAAAAPHNNPLRYSTMSASAAMLSGSAAPASARADAFQPSVGAMADVSAMLHQHAMPTPISAVSGGASGRLGAGVGPGGVGISGYVHGMHHTQAAFTVERTALEARCRAAEEALSQAERRHAVEAERLQSRASALESSLAAERQLCGQLQQQLQGDLQRLRAATEAEAAARAAETATKEMLASSNRSLELERRRAAEAAEQAAGAARELSSRVSALEAERAGLEKQLLQEKEHGSVLHKQLRDAQRQEQALMEKLGSSESARQQQEMRLEAAAEQVSAMRNELQLLNAKLAARDKQLLKHVQEMEETQLAALRSELSGAQSRLQRTEGLYAALRASMASVHQALGPQALAAAFGYSEALLSGFSAVASEYAAVADRLLSQREVAEADAAAVVQRVKELVNQTRNMYMSSEKREVALTAETDQAMNALRQTNAEAESRLASCNAALRTATQRVEELTVHLQDSRARCMELEGSLASVQQAKQELQAALGELQQGAAMLRMRATDSEGAQRELSASREQAVQLQQQVEQLSILAQRSAEAAEAKDERIRELRAALSSALSSSSAAEGQSGTLMNEKLQALEVLDAERRRCANLEAVVQATEQQLEKVRGRAEAVEASYRELCQQVMGAAKEAVTHARELQQTASPQPVIRSVDDWPTQLAALEGVLERLASRTPTTSSVRTSRDSGWHTAAGAAVAKEHDAATRLLLGCIHQLSTQQALTVQHLLVARQLLTGAVAAGAGGSGQLLQLRQQLSLQGAAAQLSPPASPFAAPPQPLFELAQAVSAASGEALQAVADLLDRETGAEQRAEQAEKQLAAARQEAARAAVLQVGLQERLAASEAELEHVKATAHAEFGRVQGEVSKAFQEAEKVREDVRAEAEARIRAAEQAAAEAAAAAQSQVNAVQSMAEARVRDAEAARTAAVALVTSLQEELAHTRSLLDGERAELKRMQDEQAKGLRHVAGLNEQLRRTTEEVARWRSAANPRTRERLVLLATVKILRRKRAELQTRLAAEKHRATQLGSAVETRRERIKQGVVQLRQLQIDNVQLTSRLQASDGGSRRVATDELPLPEAESRAARADALVSRLEERRITVDQDRKAQTDKATKLAGQLADANKALEAARKAEAAVRKDLDRLVREQLEPQQRRTATVLEELERAAQALQESQSNATRLLQQGESLRAELEDVKRAAEEEAHRAKEHLTAVSRDVTDRDAAISALRQQLSAAQAAASAAAALLPSISSGQLGDAAAIQAHLIGQLGVLQAANAELEAKRSAVETELEVLRVRLSRAEAALSAATVTPPPVRRSPVAQSLGRALSEFPALGLAGGTPLSGVLSAAALRDDCAASVGGALARDQDPTLVGAKDARIQELRAALSSVMSERAALQRELAAVREDREEGGAEIEAQAAHVRMLEDEVQRLAASLETAERQLEEVTQSARQAMQAAEAKAAERVEEAEAQAREELREQVDLLERRAREVERALTEANARGEERLRQAERSREQLSQMQALHASAEEAVRQLSSQLRELQHGNSSQVQVAAAEAQQLQVTADSLRLEVALARDTVETHEAEIRRLNSQNEAAASQARTLASQLQSLSEDLAAARTRMGDLQQELADQRAECDTLRRANEALQVNLAAAEERHVDSEAQLVEAEAALSRQQGLVRQVQAENERLHEQYGQLQQQLQQLTSEWRAAAAAAAIAAGVEARSPSPTSPGASPSRYASPIRSGRLDASSGVAAASGAQARREGGSPRGQLGSSPRRLGGLESRLLEAAVAELQAKLDALQAEFIGAETRAGQAEQDAQLLQTDLEGANARLRLAEAKTAELQSRLEASLSGSAHGVSAFKEKVLELELHLDEQRDREQAAQAALARATERCGELQGALGEAERRFQELEHRCEDKELEVGVLQAQLASASAQRLAQQAEAGQVGQVTQGSEQAVPPALELQLQLRETALLADALQELSELRVLVDTLRSEAQEHDRQRQSAALELQLSADVGTRLRAETSKLAERISVVQNELLEAQEARDRATAQLRAAEARLAEERSDVESLRRQLDAVGSQGRGADQLWVRRVADLEQALAAARQQAADAEDAVVEAAAAQVRSAGLEVRSQDLEAALAEAETRAAAAAEAETRAASALIAQREAHRQEVTELQLQVQGLQGKLAVCERQVADRDSRLDGVGKQLVALRGHTEAFEAQLREVRQELRAALQENEALQRKMASLDQEALDGGRRTTQLASSVSGVSLSSASHAPPQQLVGMLSENRDLLEKLTVTHSKLKQARAKLAQCEQEMRSKDLEAALAASQEEAAASAAAAAEAHARCEALTQRLQHDGERRASHSHASARAVEFSSPSMLERLQQQHLAGADDDVDTRNTLQALMQKIRTQRSEIETLSSELQAANAKRTELAREAATLERRLAEAEIREREFASTAETLRQQLAVTQQQLESRQHILQQLTSASQQQQGQKHIVGLLGPPSPSGASQRSLFRDQGPGEDGLRSGSTSPRSQATRPYHSTLSMTPARAAAAGLQQSPGGGGGGGPAGSSASFSSAHQLLLAQQHQQQATKLDRVVALWRDACRAKDARVQELQSDLATFSSQLERARADASALTAKVLEREQALTSCQHQLELTRDSLGAQLRAAEDKLEAKGLRLVAVEDELQGREDDLREARAQLQAAERSMLLLQADSDVQREAAARTAAELASATRQAAALQEEVQGLLQRSTHAQSGAQQATDQVQQLQEQVSRAEAVVGRLQSAVRSALSTAAAKAAAGAHPGGSGSGGGTQGGAAPGNLPTSLRLLEDLTAVLLEELQRRSGALAAAEAEAASLQGRLAAREEELQRLEARLKSAQEGLNSRLDEVSRLQTALRRKEADCEAVETEIAAQIADYQRLKQRLMQQERDSSRLSVDQEALLRRSDELEATLAAKQEECALLMRKCAQLEEQWQAGRSAMAALQERVRSLDAQSDALQRNNQAATLARQDAAAALEAARSELRAASQQAAAYREQLEQRNNEVRELNSMLQAWEAMRLGKDAQIAALLERCKRHEEDAAEKARTIEALRRKLQPPGGGGGNSRASLSGALLPGGAAGSPGSSSATPIAMAQLQQQQPRPVSSGNNGARHIHVHMHSPAVVASPSFSGVSGVSATGSNTGR
ncbi:hypothetical protein PLESTF_001635600 [Pleodorina starrii]|nr:hypothetical protein PLESTF_001635600 [Pleodorina starrii]